jgi:5-methyltetrahydropteroyltriglutamate--homocysteine methyltransferase
MSRPLPILPTTVVGSYPQPEWLIEHVKLEARGVPRIRAPEILHVAEPFLEEAQGEATRVATRDMERRDRHHHRWRDQARKLLTLLRPLPRGG